MHNVMTVNPSRLEKFLKRTQAPSITNPPKEFAVLMQSNPSLLPIPSIGNADARADLKAFIVAEKSKHDHPDIIGWAPSNKPHKTLDQIWQQRVEQPILDTVQQLTSTSEKIYLMQPSTFKNYHVVPPIIQQTDAPSAPELMKPALRRKLNEQQAMEQRAKKELKEAIRERKRLLKIAEAQHRRGILGSEDILQSSSEVYGNKHKEIVDTETKKDTSLKERRKMLTEKNENPVGRKTWKTGIQVDKDATPYDGGEKLFPSYKRPDLTSKMQSSERVKEIWLPKERDYSVNEDRLKHIFHEQTRDRGYNIINGAIIEPPLPKTT